MAEKLFRFEGLEVWQKAATFSMDLFDLAERLEQRKCFRFAEQLRAATLSITNNIAEGSGSQSNADFANFLNFARRSVFETANILMMLSRKGYFSPTGMNELLTQLEEESRMLLAFMRTLRSCGKERGTGSRE
ncbi:MAG: four helix bundle protein [Planctomycetota bacterium]